MLKNYLFSDYKFITYHKQVTNKINRLYRSARIWILLGDTLVIYPFSTPNKICKEKTYTVMFNQK